MFELKLFNNLLEDAKQECSTFALNYYRMSMGFILANQFINAQSFRDWSLSLSFVDMVLKTVFQFLLEKGLPTQLSFLYQNNRLSELMSLACLSIVFKQSLLIFILSKTLYGLFYFFAQLFSRFPLEATVIAYYFKSPWFILPLLFKVGLSLLFLLDGLLSLRWMTNIGASPFWLALFQEFGVQKKEILSLNSSYLIRHVPGYQYQFIMSYQKIKINAALSEINFATAIKEFNKDLHKLYLANPIIYTSPGGAPIILPLDLAELSKKIPTLTRLEITEIMRQYHAHPIHTVWRMFQTTNPCIEKESVNKSKHQLFLKQEYQKWFIYFYQEEKKQNQEANYLQQLAKLYRQGNNISRARGIFTVETDNLLEDAPASEVKIQQFLLGYLETSSHLDILSENKLKLKLNQFSKHSWKKLLSALSIIEFKELHHLWRMVLEQDAMWFMFAEKYPGLTLNPSLKKTFIDQMAVQYGDIIFLPFYTEMIDDFFSDKNQHDVEHHAVSINQAISEIARKQTRH